MKAVATGYSHPMRAPLRGRLPALFCALAVPASAWLVRPYVEMGLGDDWSYIHTAKLFAETGRFVYNGWGSPMLGWQVVFASLFLKLFGFSFTVARASTVLIAMLTAFLLERTFVRAGLNQANAVVGTLALMFSPLVVPLIFSFMTDIPGLFCIVLCFYACLRAVETESARVALAWILFAALTNAVGGTVRQIIWLGVLVMVPCALWLLRRNRTILWTGVFACALSAGFIQAATLWFKRQPNTVPFESVIPVALTVQNLRAYAPNILSNLSSVAPLLPFYLLPVLFIFLVALYRKQRAALLCLVAAGAVAMLCAPRLHQRPFDFFLMVMTVAASIALLLCLFPKGSGETAAAGATPLSWYRLAVLIGPFTAAYTAVILGRTFIVVFDRYLVPLMLVGVLVLLRYAQDRISPRLPLAAILPIALFGGYAIAKTHDVFSLYRGRLALIDELRASGIPDTAIDGGLPFNGWTQIEHAGVVNDARLPGASAATIRASTAPNLPCQPWMGYETPYVVPRYTIAWVPNDCDGPAPFARVVYRQWLEPAMPLYLVFTHPAAVP